MNASLIPPFPLASEHGDKPRRSYIASQAPLPHTLSTFYHQLMQHDVGLVVNLTPFQERGRTKAHEYWPLAWGESFVTEKAVGEDGKEEPGSMRYRVRQQAEPVVLDENLAATGYSLGVERQQGQAPTTTPSPYRLTLLHVTSWADFGDYSAHVFDRLLSLIERKADEKPLAPVWVHCSAVSAVRCAIVAGALTFPSVQGVGRSGTVIAGLLARDLGPRAVRDMLCLDQVPPTTTLVAEAALAGAHKLIDHARRYRPKMVQTPDQIGMVASLVGHLLQQDE